MIDSLIHWFTYPSTNSCGNSPVCRSFSVCSEEAPQPAYTQINLLIPRPPYWMYVRWTLLLPAYATQVTAYPKNVTFSTWNRIWNKIKRHGTYAARYGWFQSFKILTPFNFLNWNHERCMCYKSSLATQGPTMRCSFALDLINGCPFFLYSRHHTKKCG